VTLAAIRVLSAAAALVVSKIAAGHNVTAALNQLGLESNRGTIPNLLLIACATKPVDTDT
jgi:hypothetical protein